MIAKTKRLGNPIPAILRIPKTAKIQRIKRTPEISLNGLGKRLIANPTIARISKSMILMTWPFITKSDISGMLSPSMLIYPKNQSIAKMTINAAIINTCHLE